MRMKGCAVKGLTYLCLFLWTATGSYPTFWTHDGTEQCFWGFFYFIFHISTRLFQWFMANPQNWLGAWVALCVLLRWTSTEAESRGRRWSHRPVRTPQPTPTESYGDIALKAPQDISTTIAMQSRSISVSWRRAGLVVRIVCSASHDPCPARPHIKPGSLRQGRRALGGYAQSAAVAQAAGLAAAHPEQDSPSFTQNSPRCPTVPPEAPTVLPHNPP